MSAGGFIAQALLGGAAETGRGIGNQIREEAKLKRQQALEQTRTENTMQEQSHAAALSISQQNLAQEHDTSEAEKRRKHELSLSDKQHEQAKDLSDYDLNNKIKLASEKAKASGKYEIDPRVQVQIDEVTSRLDHLRKLETNLRTKSTDPFGGAIGGSTEEGGLTWEEINARREKATEELNILLGNTKPTPADNSLLKLALDTPTEDRPEFLEALKAENRASPELVMAVEALYASDQQQSEPSRAPSEAAETVPPTTEQQGQGGMISEAQGQTQTPAPESQPAAEPEVAPQQQPPADASTMSPAEMQRQIVERSRREGKENYDKAAKEATVSLQNLMMYGGLEKMSKSDQSRREFFNKYGQYLRGMPEDVLNELRAVFGDDAINQYLQ